MTADEKCRAIADFTAAVAAHLESMGFWGSPAEAQASYAQLLVAKAALMDELKKESVEVEV